MYKKFLIGNGRKMKCIIMCSVPISHVIPIQPIVEYLRTKNVEVCVITSKKNEDRVIQYGAKFIEYPFNFTGNNNFDIFIEREKNFRKLLKEEKYEEAYNYFMKIDIEYLYNHSFDNLKLLFNIIKKEQPTFIIRDAVDRYGTAIAKLLNIPCIGLITHCLYSKNFFEKNPIPRYKIFLDSSNIVNQEFDKYLLNFRDKCEDINNTVFLDSNTFKINTLHQFDPCEELTLINSIDGLQPEESYEKNRSYLLIYPSLERFQSEKYIDKKLISIIENAKKNDKKIIYISTGSMLSLSFSISVKLIDNLLKNNLCIVMSNNDEYIKLNEKYINNYNVYIDKFIPQQYVLSQSNIFISTAGQNSILESIYHKVPILAIPLTSEQKLNGHLIEMRGIGKTANNEKSKSVSFGSLVYDLLTNYDYVVNLEKLNYKLVSGVNQFEIIMEYVYERKKRIEDFYINR